MDGIHKIVAIKSSLNLGLSDKLKAAFTNVIRVQRPNSWDCSVKDFNWLAGFTSAEGCFL